MARAVEIVKVKKIRTRDMVFQLIFKAYAS